MITKHLNAIGLALLGVSMGSAVLADGHAANGNSGLYGFVFGGTSLNADLNYSGLIGGNTNSVDNDFDNGFQFGIGLGKTIDAWSTDTIGVRGEVELSYSDNDADSIFFSGNGPAGEVNVAGGVRTSAIFANVLVDFKNDTSLTPFVGGGVGFGRVEQDLFYGPGVTISESDTVLAAQLIAGVSYAASDSITLTADVRHREFFDITSARLNPAGASTGTVSGDYGNTSLNVGVRFSF